MSGQPIRVYLAGPMRGIPEFNFPAFDEAAAHLRGLGYDVYSPAERDRADGFDPVGMTGNEDLSSDEEDFDLGTAMLINCSKVCAWADEVWLMPGWSKSSGARAEKALAECLGLGVQFTTEAAAEETTPEWEEGRDAGEEVGFDSGFDAGYAEGWDEGYDSAGASGGV